MTQTQSSITTDPGAHSAALVLRVRDFERARTILASLAEPQRSETQLTVAVGSQFALSTWSSLPKELTAFSEIRGPRLVAPATGGDVLIHAHSDQRDLLFAELHAIRASFRGCADVIEETHGFRYRDSRDLTGFVDGTENPEPEERHDVCFVGKEDADFAGGSYVMTQRYVHDLAAWATLSDEEQEKIIGRTKPDSEELDDDDRPDSAHISRVVIEEDGDELEIFRKSFPYGTTDEAGLYFIAFNRTPSTFRKMLERMMGSGSDGVEDRLMSFSRPVSGAFFFAPSVDKLRAIG